MTEVLTRRCSAVAEFLDALRPASANAIVRQKSPYEWAFRGQGDARWKLVSKALRPGTVLGFYGDRRQYISRGIGDCLDQMNGEVVAIRQFAELADRIGLPVPGFHPFFRQDGFDLGTDGVAAVAGKLGTQEWPEADMLELMAIAQHHGVATRLLDFSFSPFVAAFFAANDIVENKITIAEQGVTEFAVWGVNIRELCKWRREFEVVEVERASNTFLRAQKGLFVLDRRPWASVQPETKSLSLDERIQVVTRIGDGTPVLVKVTLPVEHAVEVLDALSLEGVDRPHLMPSHDNVVAHLDLNPA